MALSSEQIYNSLNGEEVKEIFEIRFSELLSQISQLQSHITLPRVKMRIRIDAEIVGGDTGSAYFNVDHTFTVKTEDAETINPLEVVEMEMEINALTTPTDQIRVEHGLPVVELKRTPLGIQEEKVILEGQTHQRRSAASFTLDRGGPATAGFAPATTILKPPPKRDSGSVSPILPEFADGILKKGKK